MEKVYRHDIDILKGIAIIAVVLYHMGLMPHGYLGVDVFLVINGFLIIPTIYQKISSGNFKYFEFLKRRFIRLAPLVVIACILSLLVGCFGMLPDDYENLAESSVASLFFSNNILSSLISADYWNVVNDYKPLMHFWYVGILAEFYIIIPFIILLDIKISEKLNINKKGILLCLCIILSLLLYLYPKPIAGDKFYLLPCRFFEFGFGGLCSFISIKKRKVASIASMIGIIALLVIPVLPYTNILLLLIVVLSTMALLWGNASETGSIYSIPLRLLGKASYSIFVFHQIILAFYRYYFSQKITPIVFFIFIILLLIISYLSYRFVEKKVPTNNISLFIILGTAIPVCIVSFMIYMNAGVIRDVPELCISKKTVHRNMHAEYVDRIYSYNKDFDNNGKIKVLCIGNSFARDWANILLESSYSNYIDMSYSFNCEEKIKQKVADADCIFVYLYKSELPEWFWDSVKDRNVVFGIGVKSFGSSNGIVYARRFSKNYFDTSVVINKSFELENELRKEEWLDNYIDMLSYVRKSDGSIKVFSDKNTFISQDCAHLTQEGAKYFASLIDFSAFFGE